MESQRDWDAAIASPESIRPDAGFVPLSEDDPGDQLDALRERIRSGDLSHGERDQLDQLVFVVAVADRRTSTVAREYPGEVAVQRALSAETWARVGKQLRVMLGQGPGG